jgi:hypothetical protein
MHGRQAKEEKEKTQKDNEKMKIKLIALFLILFTTNAFAEDLMGYVLRHNYWGVDYYWVHDSSHYGEPQTQEVNG